MEKKVYLLGIAFGLLAAKLTQGTELSPVFGWATVIWVLGFWVALALMGVVGYLLGVEPESHHGHGSHGHSGHDVHTQGAAHGQHNQHH